MHIIGGEITYECLGDAPNNQRQYRFTMKIYRDCQGNGAAFDNPAEMAIYQGSLSNNNLFITFTVNTMGIKPLEADTPACVDKFPSNVCVEQATYVFTRTLPILQTGSYFIVYQRCCRNTSITNILTPGDVGATYMVELTAAAQQQCNNSPVFNNFPPIVICKDFNIDFDHSATDLEGDQLVYSFCAPFTGGGPLLNNPALSSCEGAKPSPPCAPPFDNVTFIPPLTPGNPMGGAPQITINSTTGLITGKPNMLGQFVVGVCVQEFRNGVLLSTVKRDFQFNVADCEPTVLASITTDSSKIVGPNQYVIKSCGRNTIFFNNESVDQAKIDSFEWRFVFSPDSTFSDKNNWDANVTFPGVGSYTGLLMLNPKSECGDTAYINIEIYPEVTADFAYDYDTCVAGPVVFTDQSYGDGVVNYWDWHFGPPGARSNDQNPVYQYADPGNQPVRLRVVDQNLCSDDTTQFINWFPVPPLIIIQPSSYLGCSPADIFFNNLSTPIDETYHIVWDFGDGKTIEDIISPTHTYTEPGIYNVSVSITSPIGCFTSDDFPNLIKIEPSPIANFECDPDTDLSNFNNTVQFTDLSTGAVHWNWQLGNYKTTIEQNPVYAFPDTGLVKVRLIVTHPAGCKDSMIKYLDIRPIVLWNMPNAFTPNGDGLNDGFLGKGYLEGATNFRMTIWNRWGELVYETSNPNDEWNGRAQNTGGMSPAGVYVYLVSFTGPRGEPFEFKGFATLLR
ncbi:MAG: gliding motility-associated C-terminal domain-containing protein [Lewinellaceae bacterium]|nr:gliding motility-associated C-terminal domain-containing protein [Lewinellaceae bacterium]